jgi:hypothetical protein
MTGRGVLHFLSKVRRPQRPAAGIDRRHDGERQHRQGKRLNDAVDERQGMRDRRGQGTNRVEQGHGCQDDQRGEFQA